MTLLRANSGGWGSNDQLTSTQANTMDANIAKALDKSSAGDTLAGAIGMTAAAAVNVNTAGAVVEASNGGVISATGTGRIRSKVAGGVQLGGGAADWPQFTDSSGSSAARTIAPLLQMVAPGLASSWTSGTSPGLFGGATATIQPVYLGLLPNGCTIVSVRLLFLVNTGHGALPAVMPKLNVKRQSSAGVSQSLRSTGAVTMTTPANVAAYEAAGGSFFDFTCDQFNTVVNTAYTYYIEITDENGANSQANNYYHGINPTLTLTELRML